MPCWPCSVKYVGNGVVGFLEVRPGQVSQVSLPTLRVSGDYSVVLLPVPF